MLHLRNDNVAGATVIKVDTVNRENYFHYAVYSEHYIKTMP